VLCLALGGVAIPALSGSIDEVGHVCNGVQSWYGDRDHFIEMGTLPLFTWVQNVPGALYVKARYGGLPLEPGRDIATEVARRMKPEDQLILLHLARWTNLLFSGLGTIWIVWWAALRWLGPRSAGAAAFFAAIEPNLLSGYVLATADAPIVPFAIGALVAFDSYLRSPSAKRLLGVAALVGLGTAVKISVLPAGLLLMGACLVARAQTAWELEPGFARWLAKASARFCFVEAPAVVAIALTVAWVANGCLMGTALFPGSPNQVARNLLATLGYSETEQSAKIARLESLLVPAPLSVLRAQVAHSRTGHEGMMFRGRVAKYGPIYYYLYIFALKTHLLFFVLGFVALASRDVRRSPLPVAALLFVVLSCTTRLHQGPRYFLTLYAMWAAMAGAGTWVVLDLFREGLARSLAAAAVATASLALTLGSAPDFLTHTSPLWGGDWEGYRFADANFDLAQGAFLAYSAADEKGLDPVAYLVGSYFGSAPDRDIIGDRFFEFTDELPPRLQNVEDTLARMRGRFVVVPLKSLYSYLPHHAQVPIYRALRAIPPTGRLTKLYVYYDFRSPEQLATLEELVRREIPYWVDEWHAGRRAGMVRMGPFSPDPRAP
jgi:hypothetical protein